MDKLEKFAKNHREEFDSDSPSPEVWDKIDKVLEPNRNLSSTNSLAWMWKAAAVLLFVSTFYLLIDKWQQKEPVAEFFPELEEFEEVETYYLTQIEDRKIKLTEYQGELPLTRDFFEDLSSLDSMYWLLKDEVTQTGSNEKVLDAMVQNLQLKIEILNRQLMILEKLKEKTNENDIQL